MSIPFDASRPALRAPQREDIRTEMAKRMSIHKQEVGRILDLNHATNLARIEHAFEVLGKKLSIDVRDADDRAA